MYITHQHLNIGYLGFVLLYSVVRDKEHVFKVANNNFDLLSVWSHYILIAE